MQSLRERASLWLSKLLPLNRRFMIHTRSSTSTESKTPLNAKDDKDGKESERNSVEIPSSPSSATTLRRKPSTLLAIAPRRLLDVTSLPRKMSIFERDSFPIY